MSAQDKLDRRAAKHGLGSDERKRKIQKAKDFFSKPVPTYSKDELRKMGHPVEQKESSKVPAGMKFMAGYQYKDANGNKHSHTHYRKGKKMTDPVVVYIDGKEWKTFQSFTKAKQAAISHIKGMKESVETNEGMFDIVIPPPKGRASSAKTTARNRANSEKNADKIRKAIAKDKAHSATGKLTKSHDPNKKKYQSGAAGAYFSKYENVEEKAVSKSQQKFFGMVRAVQKGDMKQAPSPEVAKAAKTMSKKDVKDFASTKHKGLPESSVEYGKSIDRIRDKEKNAAIKPKDRETLGKLADLMKKQKKKVEQTDEGQSTTEQKMYSVKYTHPTDKKSGKTTGPLSKAAADKKAAMGNRVDRVGGKYTVIPHVEAAGQEYTAVPIKTGDVSQADRLTIAKMDAIMKKRSKDKRQKESVELEENKIFFVKVGVGRDHMTVKVKAPNSREALKKMRAQHPKDKVSLDQNQKQGRPAGALESVEEATMADRTVLRAVRIAKDMAGNHTGASKRIEKMKKGLSDHPKVKDALRLANESVSSADKKPQNFRDPATGKMKVRMVPVDRDVVRGDDAARVVRKEKRFKHMRKEQMATGNSRVGKDGRDAFMKAFRDVQKTAAEIQKKKDSDRK